MAPGRAGHHPGRAGRAPPAARPRPGQRRRCGRPRRPARVGAVLNLSPCEPAADDRADAAAARPRRRPHQPVVARPAARPRLPGRHARGVRRRAARAARRPGGDRRADRPPRAELLLPPGGHRRPGRPDPVRADGRRCPTRADRHGLGGAPGRAGAAAAAAHQRVPGAAHLVTESGSAWPDEVVRTADRGQGAPDYLEDAPRRGGPRGRPGRRRWPATSPGRCWTTSSGPTGTPSGSGSCTSTTRPSAGRSRPAATGTRS